MSRRIEQDVESLKQAMLTGAWATSFLASISTALNAYVRSISCIEATSYSAEESQMAFGFIVPLCSTMYIEGPLALHHFQVHIARLSEISRVSKGVSECLPPTQWAGPCGECSEWPEQELSQCSEAVQEVMGDRNQVRLCCVMGCAGLRLISVRVVVVYCRGSVSDQAHANFIQR